MAFDYAYDLAAAGGPIMKDFDVADATPIKKGELVRFTDGYIVAGGTDYTTPYTGVAAEDKAANDGKKRIRVYCSPTAVFKVDPIETTVSASPSATVWTDSVVLLNSTADIANGAKLKIKSKAAGATGTFPVGKVVPVTDSATNTLTGAAGAFPGNTTVGDKGLLFPAINKLGPTASADNGLTLTWAATSGTALRVIDHDLINDKVFVQIKLHSFAN
jgi:hypothetical protein